MKVKCNKTKCGYEWDYKGRMIKARCPSCALLTKVRSHTVKSKQEESP